jgi:hypothetical protein
MNGSEVPLTRAIRGPVTLITVGVLFALNNFTPYRFEQTWPVILIVFGLLTLLARGTQPAPSQAPQAPPPVYNTYPPTGGYRQSGYQPTAPPQPASPEKGGFGTSAPGKPAAEPPSPAVSGGQPQGGQGGQS